MRKPFAAIAVLAICLLSLASAGLAQSASAAKPNTDSALPTDAATRDQIMTLLDLLQARRSMTAMMENMKQIMRQGAEESFRKRVPNPTPKQLAALQGIFDDVIDMPLDDMVNALIPIYQRHLTRTDVGEIIRFYSSPVGQKLLKEQPQIIQESMQAGAEIERKRMDEINAKLEERIQKLIDAEKDPGPSQP